MFFKKYVTLEISYFTKVNMARSGAVLLTFIMKIYQIWWLLVLGFPPKSLGKFFMGYLGSEAFAG